MNDLAADREAKPEAAVLIPAVLGGVVRSEYAVEVFLRYAVPAVDDGDAHPVPLGRRLREPPRLHAQFRAFRRGVHGVGKQVYQEALDEHLVHLHGNIRRRLYRDLDLLAPKLFPHHVDRLPHHYVEPPELYVGPEILGEEQRVFYICAHRFDVAHGERQQLVFQRLERYAFAGELQQRPQRGQQVVEIVRHPPGHAAQQLQFLRDHDLVPQPRLVDHKAEVFRQHDEQFDVRGGIRIARRLRAEQQQSERLFLEEKREAEFRVELPQLRARLLLRLPLLRDGVRGVQGYVFLASLHRAEDRRAPLQFRVLLVAQVGMRTEEGEDLVGLVQEDDLVGTRANDLGKQIVQIRQQGFGAAVKRHRGGEAPDLVVVFEAVSQDSLLDGLAAAAKEARKINRSHRAADHHHPERAEKGAAGEHAREKNRDGKHEPEGDDEKKSEPDDVRHDPAQRYLNIQELMLQNAIGDDYSIGHCRQAAVRINGDFCERIVIDADYGEYVIRAEDRQQGL